MTQFIGWVYWICSHFKGAEGTTCYKRKVSRFVKSKFFILFQLKCGSVYTWACSWQVNSHTNFNKSTFLKFNFYCSSIFSFSVSSLISYVFTTGVAWLVAGTTSKKIRTEEELQILDSITDGSNKFAIALYRVSR
jgi:hypothetical protein